MNVIVSEVAATDFGALAALFERDHSPCHCRFWHFAGTNKEWEARCAFEPDKNREELRQALEAGDVTARGLIARFDGELSRGTPDPIVGWMKLVPRRTLSKLLVRAPYKGLDDPAAPEDTLSIGCFLVDPQHRRSGIAGALVERALVVAKARGASFVEAYPRVSSSSMHDAEAWTGPHSIFTRLGFEVARDAPQYPVMRKTL